MERLPPLNKCMPTCFPTCQTARIDGIYGLLPTLDGHGRRDEDRPRVHSAHGLGRPSLSKKLRVVPDAPPELSRMNSVTNPSPSAICGNTTGAPPAVGK